MKATIKLTVSTVFYTEPRDNLVIHVVPLLAEFKGKAGYWYVFHQIPFRLLTYPILFRELEDQVLKYARDFERKYRSTFKQHTFAILMQTLGIDRIRLSTGKDKEKEDESKVRS